MPDRDPQPLGSLSALGTFTAPARRPPVRWTAGSPGAAERQVPAPPPGPLAFLAPWLEGAVDLVRGGLVGATGAQDTFAAKAAELAAAGLPLLPLTNLGFFSRVDKALDLIPVKGAHPSKIASILKNHASAEELAYRGVPEFLAAQGNATVTREELAAHLAAHPAPMPKVQTRGAETAAVTARRQAVADRLDALAAMEPLTPALREESRQLAAEIGQPRFPAKYAQYQLPGGEQYRETLVTLPPELKKQGRYNVEIRDPAGTVIWTDTNIGGTDVERLRQTHEGKWGGRTVVAEEIATPAGPFTSGHFDEPNILVHTRSNERTLPTGERGRLVEEVQSDWHQQGKKQGYRSEAADTAFREAEAAFKQTDRDYARLIDQGNMQPRDLPEQEWRAYQQRLIAAQEANDAALRRLDAVRNDRAVPDAPFKETWPDLGLKQQVLETAADPEAGWIGFTSGQTQAARYDLSKQISRVEYSPKSGPRLGSVRAYDLNGHQVIEKFAEPGELPDIIGKEAADKLLSTTPRTGTGAGRAVHVLEGVDLQVGGEGMRHFYDQVLPKRLEKIVKPFGGTVERGTLGGRTKAQIDAEMDALSDATPVMTANYRDAIARLQAERNAAPDAAVEAWFAKLTPEMKARILKEGLPLMSLLPLAALGAYGQKPKEATR